MFVHWNDNIVVVENGNLFQQKTFVNSSKKLLKIDTSDSCKQSSSG